MSHLLPKHAIFEIKERYIWEYTPTRGEIKEERTGEKETRP
jgi:hypothetical protein